MKNIKEYMDDPRILNDKLLMEAPEFVREVYAARLKNQDEHNVLSPEYAEHCHETAGALFARFGIIPEYVNLTGQGKLKPRAPEAVGK
jgi:hypothetical protein